MLVPLAGGGQETLLSEVGFVLLPLFSTAEACALRLVCREFLAAVTEHPWEDEKTNIKGSIGAWRACFPRALCANVAQSTGWRPLRRSTPVVDADFVHLQGLRELDVRGCTSITDAAFAHLCGIHTLRMSHCVQAGITDAAIAHLRGIHRLSMNYCVQAGITDAAFVHLRGIHTLNMTGCSQAGITDAAFAHLRGIHSLNMTSCGQAGITDAAFAHLSGIHALRMDNCRLNCLEAAWALGLPVL